MKTLRIIFCLILALSAFNAFAIQEKSKSVNLAPELVRILDRSDSVENVHKVAYCVEQMCCKTSYSGKSVCKVVCGYCPIGWNPEY